MISFSQRTFIKLHPWCYIIEMRHIRDIAVQPERNEKREQNTKKKWKRQIYLGSSLIDLITEQCCRKTRFCLHFMMNSCKMRFFFIFFCYFCLFVASLFSDVGHSGVSFCFLKFSIGKKVNMMFEMFFNESMIISWRLVPHITWNLWESL